MITAMLLKDNTDALAAYHCRGENYYFKQATDFEEETYKLTGEFPRRVDPLEYVKIHGEMAGPLGFTPGQEINEEELCLLLDGHNRSGQKVTQKHKVKGIDLTFSAPKSVSIVGLVMDKNPAIIRAHDEAVLEVMAEVEKGFATARPTSTTQWSTGKMAYATVRDGYSREHDPHLHTHVIVMNITQHQGKFMGLWTRKILQRDFNKFFGALYRVKLAAKMAELGYSINYIKHGEWRLSKVSKELEQEFSRRHEQIAVAKKTVKQDMDAWRQTRAEKEPATKKIDIFRDWAARLNRYVVDEAANFKKAVDERLKWAEGVKFGLEAKQERSGLRGLDNDTIRWQHAIKRATERKAMASEQELFYEYLKEYMRSESWKPITRHEIFARLCKQKELGYIVGVREKFIERYTSLELINAERNYMQYAGVDCTHDYSIAGEKAARYIKGYNEFNNRQGRKILSDIQGQAVFDILTSKNMVNVVQGDAGAGKTTSLKAVAEYYQQLGLEVVGVAVQAKAAENLGHEAGIKAMTLESYLERRNQPKQKIVIFDEASMLDSRNAAELLNNAFENQDRVVLVGDVNQLESIAAGRVFERLIDYYSRMSERTTAVKLITMTENYRQRNKVLFDAVSLAKQGKMQESLEMLNDKGHITEIGDSSDRRAAVAGLYGPGTLIIVNTVRARDEVNERIRENLKSAGQLQAGRKYDMLRSQNEELGYTRTIELAVGDMICFTRNEYKAYDVRNGEKAEVLECGEKIVKVRTEDKRELEIDVTEYRDIDYGYALTTFKSQGQTYNRVVVEADTSIPSLTEMRNQYVMITRARDEIKIFTDDFEDLKELAGIQTHAKDTLDLAVNTDDLEKKLEALAVLSAYRGSDVEMSHKAKDDLPYQENEFSKEMDV